MKKLKQKTDEIRNPTKSESVKAVGWKSVSTVCEGKDGTGEF